MISLLEKAINEVAKLPDADQEFFARLILEELADEKRRDESIPNRSICCEKWAGKHLQNTALG